MKFKSLSSTIAGDGDIFYELSQRDQDIQNTKQVTMILRYNTDHNIKDFFQPDTSIPNPASYRIEVDHVLLHCDENRFAVDRTEFWNVSNELVRIQNFDPAAAKVSEFKRFSPFGTLQEIVCQNGYAGVGIRLTLDNSSIKIAEVFGGSPAEKMGIKENDIITSIDKAPISGLTPEQVLEKVRGPSNTKVVLTILREGYDNPLELTVTREFIPAKTGLSK